MVDFVTAVAGMTEFSQAPTARFSKWLEGACASVLCTMLAAATWHRLEPWAYWRELVLQLSVDASRNFLARLVPDRWALQHPEHVLAHHLEKSKQKARRRDQRRASRLRST